MRVVRDRADARWLPSRHRLATFRLLAYLRLRTMPPSGQPGLVLSIDRDQNGIDHFVISALIAIVTVSYVVAALMLLVPALVAVPIALLITGFVAQIPMYILGVSLTVIGKVFGTPGENHLAVQNFVLLSLLIASACLAAVSHSWLRFIGWGVLACVVVNAIAAIFALMLRGRMAALEQRFGVEP